MWDAAAVITGIKSGNLGLALRAGFIAAATAFAMFEVGEFTEHGALQFGSDTHLLNIAGHALVGCASAVANRGRCGSGALSGAAGSFAGPLLTGLGFESKLIATSVIGGLASVAGGGKFANGAITGAFGYLFNFASNRWLRATVPGQVAFDNGVTALEEGRYGAAAFSFGVMVGEQVLTVLTLGGYRPVITLAEEGEAAVSAARGVTNPEIPKLPVPDFGMTNAQFGRLVGWGSGPEGALAATEALTAEAVARMEADGLTAEMATAWRDFYVNEFARNENNLTAGNRVDLMNKILSLMQ